MNRKLFTIYASHILAVSLCCGLSLTIEVSPSLVLISDNYDQGLPSQSSFRDVDDYSDYRDVDDFYTEPFMVLASEPIMPSDLVLEIVSSGSGLEFVNMTSPEDIDTDRVSVRLQADPISSTDISVYEAISGFSVTVRVTHAPTGVSVEKVVSVRALFYVGFDSGYSEADFLYALRKALDAQFPEENYSVPLVAPNSGTEFGGRYRYYLSKHLADLQVLDISDLDVLNLDTNVIPFLGNVDTIDLSDNDLHSVDPLLDLPTIAGVQIDLSGNRIFPQPQAGENYPEDYDDPWPAIDSLIQQGAVITGLDEQQDEASDMFIAGRNGRVEISGLGSNQSIPIKLWDYPYQVSAMPDTGFEFEGWLVRYRDGWDGVHFGSSFFEPSRLPRIFDIHDPFWFYEWVYEPTVGKAYALFFPLDNLRGILKEYYALDSFDPEWKFFLNKGHNTRKIDVKVLEYLEKSNTGLDSVNAFGGVWEFDVVNPFPDDAQVGVDLYITVSDLDFRVFVDGVLQEVFPMEDGSFRVSPDAFSKIRIRLEFQGDANVTSSDYYHPLVRVVASLSGSWGEFGSYSEELEDAIRSGFRYSTFAKPVTASPASGVVSSGGVVLSSDDGDNVQIHYTLDGSIPTTLSPVYSGPIQLSQATTIRAFAQPMPGVPLNPSGLFVGEYEADRSDPTIHLESLELIESDISLDGVPVLSEASEISVRVSDSESGGNLSADAAIILPDGSRIDAMSWEGLNPEGATISGIIDPLNYADSVPLEGGGFSQYTLELSVTDAAGNRTVAEVNFIINLEPPSPPAIVSPQHETLWPSPEITVTGTCDSPQSTVEIYRVVSSGDDELLGSADLQTGNRFTVPVVLPLDADAINSERYVYRIYARAVRRGDLSEPSSPVEINVDPTAPAAPIGVDVRQDSNEGLVVSVVSWSQPSGASPITGYRVYRREVGGEGEFFEVSDPGGVTGTTFIDEDQLGDGHYEYRVVAFRKYDDSSFGTSPYSVTVPTVRDTTAPVLSGFAVGAIQSRRQVIGSNDTFIATGPVFFEFAFDEPISGSPLVRVFPAGQAAVNLPVVKVTDTRFTVEWIPPVPFDGQAYLSVEASDRSGNTLSKVGSDIHPDAVFEIDTRVDPPLSSLDPPLFKNINGSLPLEMDLTMTEPIMGGLTVFGQLNGLAKMVNLTPGSVPDTYDLSVPFALGETGTLELFFSAVDELGNTANQEAFFAVEVYDEAPLINLPGGLAVTSLPGGELLLEWDAVSDATGYRVEVFAGSDPDFANPEFTADTADLTFTILPGTLSDASDYVVGVSALRLVGVDTGVSDIASLDGVAVDSVPPAVPSDLSGQMTSQGATISWSPNGVEAAAHYRVYRGNSLIGGTIANPVAVSPLLAGTVGSWTDPNPLHAEPYYEVTALDAAGNESARSGYVAVTDFPPVTDLHAVIESGMPLVVGWSPQDPFDRYEVIAGSGPVIDNGLATSFVDPGWNGSARSISVTPLYQEQAGPSRTITVPRIEVTVPAGDLGEIPIGLPLELSLPVKVSGLHQAPQPASLRILNEDRQQLAASGPVIISAPDASQVNFSGTVPIVFTLPLDTAIGSNTAVLEFEIQSTFGETIIFRQAVTFSTVLQTFEIEVLPVTVERSGTATAKVRLRNPSNVDIGILASANGATPDEGRGLDLSLVTPDGRELVARTPLNLIGEPDLYGPDAQNKRYLRVEPGKTREISNLVLGGVPSNAPSSVLVQAFLDEIAYLPQLDSVAVPVPLVGLGLSASALAPVGLLPYDVAEIKLEPTNEVEVSDSADATSATSVTISGRAVLPEGAGAPGVPLVVVIAPSISPDSGQTIAVTTDANGRFETVLPVTTGFLPGSYQVYARHPTSSVPPTDLAPATLEVFSARLQYDTFDLSMPRLASQSFVVSVAVGEGIAAEDLELVQDPDDAPGSDVAVAVTEVSGGFQVRVTSVADDGNAEDSFTLRLRSKAGSTPIAPENGWDAIEVRYNLSPAMAGLSVPEIPTIGGGLSGTESVNSSTTVSVANTGQLALTNLRARLILYDGDGSLVAAPSWVGIISGASLDTLLPGASHELVLSTHFSAQSESLDVNHLSNIYLEIAADELGEPSRSYVPVTYGREGSSQVRFEVINVFFDPDTSDTISPPFPDGAVGLDQYLKGVSDASVSLVPLSGDTWNVKAAHSTGESRWYSVQDLAPGTYQLRVTAPGHENFQSIIDVLPNDDDEVWQEELVVLKYGGVTVEWDVQPVDLEDRYEIVLETTFQTHVPVPTVVIEPAIVTLPDLSAGESVTIQVTARNVGLITAFEFDPPVPSTNDLFRFEPINFTSTPFDLRAGETRTFLYRVIALPNYSEAP